MSRTQRFINNSGLSIAFMVIGILGMATPLAHAYSLYPDAQVESSSNTTGSGGFSGLLSPFTNFFNSVQSIKPSDLNPGSLSAPIGAPTLTGIPNGMVQDTVHNGFYQFDSWLYGIAGFHISTIFIPFLKIFSWILGFLKGIADWLVGALH
jgi:hypothetical protein